MGLFGKGKADYLRAALDMYLDNISRAAESQFEYSVEYHSWGVGAYAIFEGLKEVPRCKMTPDRLDKAKLLLEVGIQAMISFWYHNLDSQESHSAEEKELARKVALGNVQTFLGINSEDSIELYLGFDRELQRYLSKEGNVEHNLPNYYVSLFYKRCLECITGEQIFDWGKLQFPIESEAKVIQAVYKKDYGFKEQISVSLHPVDSLKAWFAIMSAVNFMFDEFRRVHEKE